MGGKKLRWIQLFASVLILVILFFNFDLTALSAIELRLSAPWWAGLAAIFFVALWLRSYRWQVLMNAEEGVHVGHINSFKYLLVGTALNMVLPAGAGDIARSYFGYKWTGIKERMLSVSLLDKLIAIGSLAILGIVSIYLTGKWYFIWAVLGSAGPLCLILFLDTWRKIPLFDRLFEWANKKVKKIDLEQFSNHLKVKIPLLLWALFLSVMGWLCTYAVLWLCFEMVGLQIDFTYVLAMGPLLTLTRLFPFTFNGLGTDEAVMVLLFAMDGNGKEEVLVAALIFRLILLVLPALFGGYFLLVTKKMKSGDVAEKV